MILEKVVDVIFAIHKFELLEILYCSHEVRILRVWVAFVAHLVEEGDVAALELGISVCKVRSEYVAYTEAVTADLVCIGRSDTLEGGTDLSLAHGCFVGSIEESVGREDEVRLLSDYDALGYRDAGLSFDILAFAPECDSVKYDTVSYDILCVLSEDS